jgi:hypothetical protein
LGTDGDGGVLTYTLKYNDGFVEKGVRRYRLKLKAHLPTTHFRLGEEVDVRHKGGYHWYPGRIKSVNGDDTYGVVYDDGDSEDAVPMKVQKSSTTCATVSAYCLCILLVRLVYAVRAGSMLD